MIDNNILVHNPVFGTLAYLQFFSRTNTCSARYAGFFVVYKTNGMARFQAKAPSDLLSLSNLLLAML